MCLHRRSYVGVTVWTLDASVRLNVHMDGHGPSNVLTLPLLVRGGGKALTTRTTGPRHAARRCVIRR